ncbi:hypothetical protein Fot_09116 [Forsythia ovata]|uniref:Uncharacterized protein n=1 Tax=Forsythia ovata TaxID=205694 RepID=A0ABD1WD35_9LAMI
MCRGFQQIERDRLRIKAFYIHLSVSCTRKVLPDFLTLHYLPRINGSPLEINGSDIKPDSPGFVTLDRVLLEESKGVLYGSRERVKVCEGVRFEIYVGDVKVLKGTFGKDDGENWKMECKCCLTENDDIKVKDAEVCVAVEGQAAVMREKVEMVVARRSRTTCCKLEEIPEEREREFELESDCCCCCSDCDGGGGEMEVEMETVGWALDVGIWVMCIGVGYLVSVASSKSLRRKRLI